MSRIPGLDLRVALIAVLLSMVAASSSAESGHYTPVVLSALAAPNVVDGSDGDRHLVYEVMLTNASKAPWIVERLEVLEKDGERVLKRYDDDAIPGQIQGIADHAPTSQIDPGQSVIFFVHVPLGPGTAVPSQIQHRLTLSMPGGIPPGLLRFAGLDPDAEHLVEIGAPTPVVSDGPVVLGAPLTGDGWIAADGCCTATRHIRAFLAVDGELFVAQRFAIDWEKINDERKLFVGDKADPRSYFAYGEDILAVADGTVVKALDGLPDQVPGELPPGLPISEADGNHVVLDLGDGRYALYAHMIPGSLTVSGGDRVRRGQLLGRVGNSGNSSAPHLHFHVMSSPSPLGSNGLPYVIDSFHSTGRVASTEAFDKGEADGTPLEMGALHEPRHHGDQLPMDQTVVSFLAQENVRRRDTKN